MSEGLTLKTRGELIAEGRLTLKLMEGPHPDKRAMFLEEAAEILRELLKREDQDLLRQLCVV